MSAASASQTAGGRRFRGPLGKVAPAMPPSRIAASAAGIAGIERKVAAGERISACDALVLFRHPDLPELGAMADEVRHRKHSEPVVTYVVGRNINYTNVCWVRCSFCNFYREPGAEGGYVLADETIYQKLQELVDLDGVEVLLQGGLNPKLKIDYYERLFRGIKSRFPVHLHALSTSEIAYVAHLSNLSVRETLERLRAAGLDTVPGAGGEVLSDDVRETIAPLKGSADAWLAVMREAHGLGMRTTATMMYGSVETTEQRIEHLQRVRDLQDQTGGFTAFITWSFQSQGTQLTVDHPASGYDHLRTMAVSRIFLDNIDNLQASWVTQGPKIAQLSLHFGCNDFGSTMMEENVVSAAGTCFSMPIDEVHRLIEDAGYRPQRRNTLYAWLPTPPPPRAPSARLASPQDTHRALESGESLPLGIVVTASAGEAGGVSPATGAKAGGDGAGLPPAGKGPERFEPSPHARRITRPDALESLKIEPPED
ncbi:MAG: cyclic dehypoxanthinyl futalosine synthase [Acidobacteriota bacterium]